MAERRYTDREFARIMAASAEAQAAPAGRPLPARSGLTLAEMQGIATEVGVSPDAVARHARTLPLEPETETARLLGGPVTIQLEFRLAAEADEAVLGRVLETIRRITAQQGTAARTASTLEWSSGAGDPLAINLNAAGGGTRVQILCDRSTAATMTTLLAVLIGGVTIGVSGAILEPTGVLPVSALVLGIAGTAAATARTIWAVSTRRCRALLTRLTGALTDVLESQR